MGLDGNNICSHYMHFLGSRCIQNAFMVRAISQTTMGKLTVPPPYTPNNGRGYAVYLR